MTAYATTDELQAQIGKRVNDAEVVLTALIEAASRAIDGYCNRPDGFVASDTATARAYPGSGLAHQWIDECIEVTLVEAKTSVTETSYMEWTTDSDWLAFRGDPTRPDFNRTPYHGVLALPSGNYARFTVGMIGGRAVPTVRVTAKWGYAATVPAQIKQACITIAARWFKRGEAAWADTLGNADMGIMQYRKLIDPDVQMMLKLGRFIRPAM